MKDIKVLGIDLTKNVFQLHGIKRVSGKGNITGITMMMFKLKPLYGDRFNDELCSADSKINVI